MSNYKQVATITMANNSKDGKFFNVDWDVSDVKFEVGDKLYVVNNEIDCYDVILNQYQQLIDQHNRAHVSQVLISVEHLQNLINTITDLKNKG